MPPADGSLMVAKIAADLRPSADGSAVRTSLVAKLQAASAPWSDRRMDSKKVKKSPYSITKRRVP